LEKKRKVILEKEKRKQGKFGKNKNGKKK